jgi:hypothetical protein
MATFSSSQHLCKAGCFFPITDDIGLMDFTVKVHHKQGFSFPPVRAWFTPAHCFRLGAEHRRRGWVVCGQAHEVGKYIPVGTQPEPLLWSVCPGEGGPGVLEGWLCREVRPSLIEVMADLLFPPDLIKMKNLLSSVHHLCKSQVLLKEGEFL